jgi:hypothetical protein
MFTVQDVMDLFLTETVIESMGNWYPRVLAVMSCVIPTLYILFTFVTVAIFLVCIWKLVTK